MPFGGEHPPNRHENYNHLFNSGFGAKNRLNQHEIDNHLFNSGFDGKNRLTDTKMTTITNNYNQPVPKRHMLTIIVRIKKKFCLSLCQSL